MICSCNIDITWTNHVLSILHLVSILGWYHWPCNIDITKYRFYMAARIEPTVISEVAATDLTNLAVHPGPFLYVAVS
jgi:hypothetical protein